MPNVQAVVVAFNRRELLAASVAAIQAQAQPVQSIHVIDNASTDGTSDMVRSRFSDVELHTFTINTGGAGGFAAGLAFALEQGADLVWLMDDDTVPQPGALAALLDAYQSHPDERPAMIASKVIWTDGRDHPMNTPRVRPGVSRAERARAAAVGCLPVRSASFVSLLVEAEAVRQSGLPIADFFLWNDDFEFTTRIAKHRPALYCPASVVEHRTKVFGSTNVDPGERFYFEVRNKVWTFSRSKGLRPLEKVVYAGSTLRRWGVAFAGSGNRRVLAAAMGRGLKDGLRAGPSSTHSVLQDAGIDVPLEGEK